MALEFMRSRYVHPAIDVNHGTGFITIKLQDGPIKEVGANGCQVDDIIGMTRMMLESLNDQFPCRENSIAITKLQEAQMWLLARGRDREARGVEGYNKP